MVLGRSFAADWVLGRAFGADVKRFTVDPAQCAGREPHPRAKRAAENGHAARGRVQLAMTDDRDIRRARALARILDTAVGIPGTKIRLGLDPVLGLVPGAGDVASAMLSAYIVLVAANKGAPRPVIWRMLGNIAVDTALGSVPVLGDLFDVAFKSNIRNVELLERYAVEPAAVEKRSRGLAVLVIVVVALLVAAIGTAGFLLVRLLWRLLNA